MHNKHSWTSDSAPVAHVMHGSRSTFFQFFPFVKAPTIGWAISCHISRHLSAPHPLRPNVASSIKPEIHNITQRRRKRTEPRPQGICTQSFVKIGPEVGGICSRTDRQTYRQTDRRADHNTPHSYRVGVITAKS